MKRCRQVRSDCCTSMAWPSSSLSASFTRPRTTPCELKGDEPDCELAMERLCSLHSGVTSNIHLVPSFPLVLTGCFVAHCIGWASCAVQQGIWGRQHSYGASTGNACSLRFPCSPWSMLSIRDYTLASETTQVQCTYQVRFMPPALRSPLSHMPHCMCLNRCALCVRQPSYCSGRTTMKWYPGWFSTINAPQIYS